MKTLPAYRLLRPRLVLTVSLLSLALTVSGRAEEKGWIDLTSGNNPLEAYDKPGEGWMLADSVEMSADNPRRLTAKEGRGILVNSPKGRAKDLITKKEFTDVEVHVEFLIPKGSNSGVKLMGLYEIQIMDTRDAKKLSGDSCGGIYPRAENAPRYHHIDEGTAPKVNAAKSAGEWQTLDIVFQAPRFNDIGRKTANARFVQVVLNGQVVHENVEVEYPTGAAWRLRKEVASGPLLLQGDHGSVAFRNVRIRPRPAETPTDGK